MHLEGLGAHGAPRLGPSVLDCSRALITHGPAQRSASGAAMATDEDDQRRGDSHVYVLGRLALRGLHSDSAGLIRDKALRLVARDGRLIPAPPRRLCRPCAYTSMHALVWSVGPPELNSTATLVAAFLTTPPSNKKHHPFLLALQGGHCRRRCGG